MPIPRAGQHRADKPATDQAVAQVFQACSAQARPIAARLLALVLRVHPDAHILAWPRQGIVSFGVGPRKMSQHYAYIGVHATHVNLGFYRGSALDHVSSLLQGTGMNLRHVKLRSLEQATAAELLALLRLALGERLSHGAAPG